MSAGIAQVLAEDRILPLFTPSDPERAAARLAALERAGIRAAELTLRSPESLADFCRLRDGFPRLLLGAGTVLNLADGQAALDAGADFLVSPCLIPEVALLCREAGLSYLPGAGTVREVFEARQAGAAVVKLFPGEVLGPAFVRALLGPLPATPLLITGGVEATLPGVRSWLEAGALAAGLGSRLFREDETGAGLERRVAGLLAGLRDWRAEEQQ